MLQLIMEEALGLVSSLNTAQTQWLSHGEGGLELPLLWQM